MQVEELTAARKMGDDDEIAEARKLLEEALEKLQEKMAGLDSTLRSLFGKWDAALETGTEADRKAVLDRMSELLSHRSYIRNLVRDIKEEI